MEQSVSITPLPSVWLIKMQSGDRSRGNGVESEVKTFILPSAITAEIWFSEVYLS